MIILILAVLAAVIVIGGLVYYLSPLSLGWLLGGIVAAWDWTRNHIFYFFCLIVLSLLATATGMIWEIPWLTGLGMLIAILLLLAAWTPVGISLRLLRVTGQVYPQNLGKAILVACALGLFGVYYPEYVSNWRFIIPTSILLIIFLSFAWSLGETYRIFNWVVLVAAIGMTTLVVFRFARPDLHRATGRYLAASEKYAVSWMDRSSLNRQADSLATYAIVREDSVLYDGKNSPDTVSVKTGQTVMVVKIKDDLPEENDGMSEPLVQVALQDQHGNFVNPAGTIFKVPRSKLGKYMVASNIYDDPYIKLPKIITLKKKGEFGGTLPFKEDTTVIITVERNPVILRLGGVQNDLPIGNQPCSVKKGDKLLFVGKDNYVSIITLSN